jgi:hypothetical protein
MRDTTSFHPEWGYLAPAPSFIRTIRLILIATAIGATAGGGVVLSLIDRTAGQTSVAARTLVRPVQSASTPSPQTAQPKPAAAVKSGSANASGANGHLGGAAVTESGPSLTTPGLAGIAALTEVRVETDDAIKAAAASVPAPEAPVSAPMEKKATRKHYVTRYASRGRLFGREHYMNGGWHQHYTNATSGGWYHDGRWGGFNQNSGGRYNTWGYSGG